MPLGPPLRCLGLPTKDARPPYSCSYPVNAFRPMNCIQTSLPSCRDGIMYEVDWMATGHGIFVESLNMIFMQLTVGHATIPTDPPCPPAAPSSKSVASSFNVAKSNEIFGPSAKPDNELSSEHPRPPSSWSADFRPCCGKMMWVGETLNALRTPFLS